MFPPSIKGGKWMTKGTRNWYQLARIATWSLKSFSSSSFAFMLLSKDDAGISALICWSVFSPQRQKVSSSSLHGWPCGEFPHPCTYYVLTLLLRFLLAGGWLTSLSCLPWHAFLICKEGVELKPWQYTGIISSKTWSIIPRLFFKCMMQRPDVSSWW